MKENCTKQKNEHVHPLQRVEKGLNHKNKEIRKRFSLISSLGMALTVDQKELIVPTAGGSVFVTVTSTFDCRAAFKVFLDF